MQSGHGSSFRIEKKASFRGEKGGGNAGGGGLGLGLGSDGKGPIPLNGVSGESNHSLRSGPGSGHNLSTNSLKHLLSREIASSQGQRPKKE